ncbi:MAG: hypothetical protein IIC50_10980 [Planctomycetes bacterium]|nr:hypothetical protein [Planctomycetota bacterium]
MTPTDAIDIIAKYHRSIKDLRPNAIVQSYKAIPCTSARIKYAHFVYGEALIKSDSMTEESYQELLESFGLIDSYFSEASELTNAKYREYLEGLRNSTITEFRMPNPFGEIEAVSELYNFLGECWFIENRTQLFDDSPLGAFVYDELRKKAIKDDNIRTLIDMVNSSLTRAVSYPKKKSNEDSVFI